ncbi:MFS transporter [Actinosynnema mirum]|uniref:Major facilitator superfamily MFS_1 n=1 Tax=Actinosynnema mirum (strain ATCC 29888 / DSM 43827 / JCM 3225 / NBRC 14064 / NCIMB 13271 / NRRL B-12336 / IMRU 3971 / 101) TaxID=446462 RepID=C6WAZ6_ACTMD|nr:MFS transporter [Actinosynnema mirum]ACU37465.1 major facilitator superfamily MFS_1 [Actinosynnema mirum DSM 43827]
MTTTFTGAGARLLAPARLPSFRLLWAGQALSLLGDGFSYIAFAWITLELTGSTLQLGYVLALQAIPRALLTLVGGSLSDRWSTRRLMVLSSWARAAVMASVGLAGLSGSLGFWGLCAAAAAFGAVDAFFQPARMSILPSVVAKDLLPASNALLGAGAKVSSVLGPAVGGVVVAATDANYAFLVDALCFALCALCVTGVRTLPRDPEQVAETAAPEQVSLLGRIKEGLRYALSDPRIRTVLVVDMAVTFCYAGPFTVGFANLARTEVQGGSTTLGVLNGALAAGAMLGTLVGGAGGGKPRVGLLVAALAGWLAVGMAALGFVEGAAEAVATVFLMGFGIGYQGVFGLSWIQRNIKGSVLSRVISVDMVLGYAVAPLSLVLCGALAERNTTLMFGGTAVILAVTALGVLASKPVREMR